MHLDPQEWLVRLWGGSWAGRYPDERFRALYTPLTGLEAGPEDPPLEC